MTYISRCVNIELLMAQKLTKSDLAYIKGNFKHRSNRQLAEDLKVEKTTIVHALNTLGLKRTREEEMQLKTKGVVGPAQGFKAEPPFQPVPFSFHRIALIIIFSLVFI